MTDRSVIDELAAIDQRRREGKPLVGDDAGDMVERMRQRAEMVHKLRLAHGELLRIVYGVARGEAMTQAEHALKWVGEVLEWLTS